MGVRTTVESTVQWQLDPWSRQKSLQKAWLELEKEAKILQFSFLPSSSLLSVPSINLQYLEGKWQGGEPEEWEIDLKTNRQMTSPAGHEQSIWLLPLLFLLQDKSLSPQLIRTEDIPDFLICKWCILFLSPTAFQILELRICYLSLCSLSHSTKLLYYLCRENKPRATYQVLLVPESGQGLNFQLGFR